MGGKVSLVSFLNRAGAAIKSPLRGILGVAGVIAFWDLAYRLGWIDPLLLVSPSQAVAQLWHGWTYPTILQSTLLQASLATMHHFLAGFSLAIVVGLLVGAILSMTRVVSEYSSLVVRLLQYTPPAALFPLLILYAGRGETTILIYVMIGSMWPIALHTRDSFVNRDSTLVAVARNLGWTGWALFRGVLLPASISEIIAGIRIASSVALITAIVGEFLAGDSGLGFEILLAQRSFEYRAMFSGIVTLALVGLLVNYILLYIERWLTRWRRFGQLASQF